MLKLFFDKKVDDTFILTHEQKLHLKVLRLEGKNFLAIFEGDAYEVKYQNGIVKIVKRILFNREFDAEVIVAIPLIKLTRFEWMLEKVTELGATKIVPFKSDFTNLKFTLNENKILRWKKIILSASEQSFRNYQPQLVFSQKKVFTLKEVTKKYAHFFSYIAHFEEENNAHEPSFFSSPVILYVGPEGGFSEAEMKTFKELPKHQIISLGRTILRSETAILKMLSLIKS